MAAEVDRSPEMRKMKIQLSALFPDEIIEEIFSRVAVEPLMKFRCVSKSLNALIGSKRFIKLHLENSRKNRSFPYQRVIMTPGYTNGFEAGQCSLQSLSKLEYGYSDLVDFPMSNVVLVVGSRNGVVCVMTNERDFVMWNPATRAVRNLPPLEHNEGWKVLTAELGWEDESRVDDYKVFVFLLDRETHHSAGSLYSSDTNSWSTASNQRRISRIHGNGQFLSGKFHLLIERVENWKWSYEIVSFDSRSGEFGMIGAPSGVILDGDYRLTMVGGCLCVLCSRRGWRPAMDVWVMKEYGVVKSWQKVGAVELQLQLQPSWFVRVEDGEILLLPGFLFCCPDGEIRGTWVNFLGWSSLRMHLHIQSLISP